MILDAFTDEGAGRGSGEPRPSFPIHDLGNMAISYAKLQGQGPLSFALRGPDSNFQDIAFGKLGVNGSAAPRARAVSDHIGHVLGVGFPRQVPRINASEMAIAAGVRGLVLRCWWFAVDKNAGNARRRYPLATDLDNRAPLFVRAVRPDEAIISSVRNNHVVQKCRESTAFGAAQISSSGAPDSSIVLTAIAVRIVRLAASINGAYTLLSHAISFTSGWLERRAERYNAPRHSFIAMTSR